MEAILLSRGEAAAALGLGRRTIDQMISSGRLRVRRIGRRVLIPRCEIERIAIGEQRASDGPGSKDQKQPLP